MSQTPRQLSGLKLPGGERWSPAWTASDDQKMAEGLVNLSGDFDGGQVCLSQLELERQDLDTEVVDLIAEAQGYMARHKHVRSVDDVILRLRAVLENYGGSAEGFLAFQRDVGRIRPEDRGTPLHTPGRAHDGVGLAAVSRDLLSSAKARDEVKRR